MTFEDLFLADLVIPKLCLIVIGKVFIYMCIAKKFVDEIRDRQNFWSILLPKTFFLVNQYKSLKLAVLKFIEAKNLFFPTLVGTLIHLGKLRLSPLVCTHAIFSKIVVCLLR